MRTTISSLSYTEAEIRSFLPTGWNLTEDGPGAWDSKNQVWRTTVIDNVDFDWTIEVTPNEASSLGRLEAMQKALNRVFRERLGKRHFGFLKL